MDELDTDGLSILATALDPQLLTPFQQLKFLSNEQRSEEKAKLLRRASALKKLTNTKVQRLKLTLRLQRGQNQLLTLFLVNKEDTSRFKRQL